MQSSIQVPADPKLQYLLRLGDTCLILGQRLGEWCGHAPTIEVDLSISNLALDLIGQATLFLGYAGEVEGKERDAVASTLPPGARPETTVRASLCCPVTQYLTTTRHTKWPDSWKS